MKFSYFKKRVDFTLLILLFFTLIISTVTLMSPYEERISLGLSDSVEYSVSALNYFVHGKFGFYLNNRFFPSRYHPFYSIFFVVPSFALFGNDIANAPIISEIFAGLGYIVCFYIGYLISGSFGGFLGALFIFLVPAYNYFGRMVLTDVPCTVFALILSVFFIKKSNNYLVIGIFGAIAFSLKFSCIFFIIPFIFDLPCRNKDKKLTALFQLIIPYLVISISTCIYNYVFFNSIFRSGYHFWSSVPYDYLNLTFSLNYVPEILHNLTEPATFLPLLFCLITLLIILKKFPENSNINNQVLTRLVNFTFQIFIYLFIFYSLYFYKSPRFFLPFATLFGVLNGSIIASFLQNNTSIRKTINISICGMLTVFVIYFQTNRIVYSANYLEAISDIEDSKNRNYIISKYNTLYTSTIAKQVGNLKDVFPFDRSEEFASKFITSAKVINPIPYPQNSRDHRCRGILPNSLEVYTDSEIMEK